LSSSFRVVFAILAEPVLYIAARSIVLLNHEDGKSPLSGAVVAQMVRRGSRSAKDGDLADVANVVCTV